MSRQVTIATHHGSRVSISHNRRDEKVASKEEHIDLTRPHETWFEKSLEIVYEEQFGEAIREYDAKQKRASRRIGSVKNYMEKIQQERLAIEEYNIKIKMENKAHAGDKDWKPKKTKAAPALVYEEIVGVYQQNDEEITEDEKKKILKEYVKGWAERNKSMALVGVYYHADEEGKDPHVHIDYVPVGTGYTRGQQKQNSYERACNAMGYTSTSKTQTAQMQWQAAENDYLQKICEEHDLEVLRPQKGKKSKHKSTAQYKLEKQLEQMKEENEKLKEQNKKLKEQNKKLESIVNKGFIRGLISVGLNKFNEEKTQAVKDKEQAEQARQTAEEQAQQALKMVQEAKERLKVIQDTIEEEKAHSKALREDMGNIMANVRILLAALKKQESATVSVRDANLLQVAKDIKFEDGKTMYDLLEQKAIQVKKANQKQIKQFGDSLESKITKQTRRSIPDVSHIVSEQHDNDFSL